MVFHIDEQRNPDLNNNLSSRCLKGDPACECGAANETVDHYFLRCLRFSTQRDVITNSPNAMYFNMNTINHGSDLLHGENLKEFQTCLQLFIIDSKRFE